LENTPKDGRILQEQARVVINRPSISVIWPDERLEPAEKFTNR